MDKLGEARIAQGNWINLARRDYKTLDIPFAIVYYLPQSALFFIIARRTIYRV